MHNSTNNNLVTKFLALTVFMVFTFSCSQLDAQITINENVFTNWIGKKIREVQYETSLDIDGQLADLKLAVGPDQVWDFSDLSYIDSTVIIYEAMDIDPDDPFLENEELAGSQYILKVTLLPGAGGVLDSSVVYSYANLEDGVWTVNGSFTMIDIDLDGAPDSVLQFYVPPFLEVPFPVTITSEWYDSTNLIANFDGMEFVGGVQIDTTKAQGYGTLITPYGSAEALRLHNKNITKVPNTTIVDVSNDYDFVTADDMISASIVVEDERAFHNIRTVIGTSSTYDLGNIKFLIQNVSPNPFSEYLDVKMNIKEAGDVQFTLISADGTIKSLLKKDYLASGIQNIQLSAKDIPSGMYFLQVRSGRFLQHIAVSKI